MAGKPIKRLYVNCPKISNCLVNKPISDEVGLISNERIQKR